PRIGTACCAESASCASRSPPGPRRSRRRPRRRMPRRRRSPRSTSISIARRGSSRSTAACSRRPRCPREGCASRSICPPSDGRKGRGHLAAPVHMLALIGIAVVTVSVLLGFVLEGGPLLVLLQPAEFMIIGGAAAGSLLIATPPT